MYVWELFKMYVWDPCTTNTTEKKSSCKGHNVLGIRRVYVSEKISV